MEGTLNYSVALGDFSGGGLLLESPEGKITLPLPDSEETRCFVVHDTKAHPLAFDGSLWHGTQTFSGNRWVITAYTCRRLEEVRAEDIALLKSWGFPLPSAEIPKTVPLSSATSPCRFCLLLADAPSEGLSHALAADALPFVQFDPVIQADVRDLVFRAAAEGVFPFIMVCIHAAWSPRDMEWVLHLCHVGFSAGAQVVVDISTWPSCWETPLFSHSVSSFLRCIVSVPPCAFGEACGPAWLFVTSSEAFASFGDICARRTCTLHSKLPPYPQKFKVALCNLLPGLYPVPVEEWYIGGGCVGLHSDERFGGPPHAWVDGGGLQSNPDWSGPAKGRNNTLKMLRHTLMSFCGKKLILSRLREHLREKSDSPLFTEQEVGELRKDISAWFSSENIDKVDWCIPEGQPYCLHALATLSHFLQDVDTTLFGCLLQGVPTGFKNDIPPSGCMAPSGKAGTDESLQVCQQNWQGAEDDPVLLDRLVQQEVDKGWLHRVESLEEAKRLFPQVAVGKMNIVHSEGRDPRLVVDSSICGTNAACSIPERSALPTLQSILSAWPLRGLRQHIAAWSLDVKAAHKSIRVRRSEQGLLGVRVGNTFFFYSVCPFGAAFSAYWFARLGAFLVRTLHLLIYISHFLALYVDDLLGFQVASVAEMSFSITLAFCAAFGVPLSWKKLQFGTSITWIGWQLDFAKGCVCIPPAKLERLKLLLQGLCEESILIESR